MTRSLKARKQGELTHVKQCGYTMDMFRSYAVGMRQVLLLALALSLPRSASAQTAAAKKEPSAYDKIWGEFTEWYSDDTNPIVQRVLLSGRFHEDFASVESDQGNHSEWNVRRLRIGPRITLFKKFTFHMEVELDPQRHDPFYVRFTDFYVQWTKNPRWVLTVGKQSVPFTLDGANSSRELLTIDRSNLANNMWFPQEYIPGVSVSGKRAQWVYRAGLYSAGAMNREFGEFTGGLFTLGTLGFDFAPKLGVKEALLTGSYVYQDPDSENTFTRQLEPTLPRLPSRITRFPASIRLATPSRDNCCGRPAWSCDSIPRLTE